MFIPPGIIVQNEYSIEVTSLYERRLQRDMKISWEGLALAVGALKDSEFHLLRAFSAMKTLKKYHEMYKAVETCSENTRGAEKICHEFLDAIGNELGYEDPFSTSSSSSDE